MAASAQADVVVQLFGGYGGGGVGGEYDVRISPGSDAMDQAFDGSIPLATRTSYDPLNTGARQFATFCLERNETVFFGNEYIATISDAAASGGFDTEEGDPISPETAFLFSQFAQGNLSNYDYGTADGAQNSHRDSDATALQSVIWWFEGEIDPIGTAYTYGTYDPFNFDLAKANLSKQAFKWWQEAIAAGWTDIGSVRVMNLWDTATGAAAQNQLVFASMIPSPGAAVLGCIGLAAIGLRRRRRA
jgi:hypothetical protein